MVDWPIVVVLAFILVLLVLFFREVLPIPITALLSAVVLTGVGILTPEEGLSGFSNPATIAVLAMFVLSAGLERTGAVAVLTRFILRWAGTNHRRQTLAFGLAAGPASGFVNNTPMVAALIPAAMEVARRSGRSPSKLLMPISLLAMLGGTITLIGTSTNLLGNALLRSLGVEPFRFFDFAPYGLVALGLGLAYFLLLGGRLLPDRGRGDAIDRFDLKGFLSEFEVPDGSPAVGRTLAEAGLTWGQGVQVIRVVRDGQYRDAPRSWFPIQAGDQILVEASRQRLAALPAAVGLNALPEVVHGLPGPPEQTEPFLTAEVVVTMGSRYLGMTVGQIDFRNRFDVLVLAVRHQGRLEIGPISKSRLGPGDVLLVQGTARAIERLREQPHLYLTRERPAQAYRRRHLPWAVLILASVVATASLGLLPVAIAALAGAVAMVLTGCLRIDEFLGSIRWDIILLLAGIIPLGVALTKTGAADLLAQGLVGAGFLMPPLAFLIIVFVFTSLVTEVVSNNASVVLLVPIVVAAALALGLDPRPVALTAILAASTSMLTPIGYQTNTMVYAPGGYRFSDYVRVGGPLNLILALAIPWTIAQLMPL